MTTPRPAATIASIPMTEPVLALVDIPGHGPYAHTAFLAHLLLGTSSTFDMGGPIETDWIDGDDPYDERDYDGRF